MPKAKGDIYTFRFRLQPREVHEARRIALFIKDALRQHGLKLVNLEKESHNPPITGKGAT
jgi:hypothetical protein